jgi:anti-sigma B factor antagonist
LGQEFGVSDQQRDGASVVTPHGEVDMATAPALSEHLDEVIDRNRGHVVVDLTPVTFIDSTGLGVLISAKHRCDEAGRELRVVISQPNIRKVFEITGLTDHFTLYDALDPALRA